VSTTQQPERVKPGRKRNPARDVELLEATLEVLAERGFDATSIDLVAARARASKATLYRRWPSKTELVLEALALLDTEAVYLADLPDTGTLRGDLVAMLRPRTAEQDARRVAITADLAALSRREPVVAERAMQAVVTPWIELNRLLIERAVARGEYPPADVGLLASVVPSLVTYQQAVRGHPVTHDEIVALIDQVLLAALRGGRAPGSPTG
jgi:AcrR family transcriptional regulator